MYMMVAVEKKAMKIRDMTIEKMAKELKMSFMNPNIESTITAAPMTIEQTMMAGLGMCSCTS
jgi:hypothetical protein